MCAVVQVSADEKTPLWSGAEGKDKAVPRGWRGVGEFEEDWGELNTGKKAPGLFVLDMDTWQVTRVCIWLKYSTQCCADMVFLFQGQQLLSSMSLHCNVGAAVCTCAALRHCLAVVGREGKRCLIEAGRCLIEWSGYHFSCSTRRYFGNSQCCKCQPHHQQHHCRFTNDVGVRSAC